MARRRLRQSSRWAGNICTAPPPRAGAYNEPGEAILVRNKANRVPHVHRPLAPPEMAEGLPEIDAKHAEHLLFRRSHNVAPRPLRSGPFSKAERQCPFLMTRLLPLTCPPASTWRGCGACMAGPGWRVSYPAMEPSGSFGAGGRRSCIIPAARLLCTAPMAWTLPW